MTPPPPHPPPPFPSPSPGRCNAVRPCGALRPRAVLAPMGPFPGGAAVRSGSARSLPAVVTLGGPRDPSGGLRAPARPVAAPQPRAMHPGCSRSLQPAAIFPRPVAIPPRGLRCPPSRCSALQLRAVALTRCSPSVLCSASRQPAARSARCSAPRLLALPNGPPRCTPSCMQPLSLLQSSPCPLQCIPAACPPPKPFQSFLALCNAPQSLCSSPDPLQSPVLCRALSSLQPPSSLQCILAACNIPRPIAKHSSCVQARQPVGIPPGPLQPLSSLQHPSAACRPPSPLQSLHPIAVHLECTLGVTHRAGEHHPKSTHPAQCQHPRPTTNLGLKGWNTPFLHRFAPLHARSPPQGLCLCSLFGYWPHNRCLGM